MKKFVPDYRNIVDAAKNVKPKRLPLYEHNISVDIMEKILNKKFLHFFDTDLDEFFRHYCEFCEIMGYDVVTFEVCAGESMPYSGALGGHKEGHIKTMQDFKQYPWDEVCDRYFERAKPLFEALRRQMPEGMKGIGGVGNGVFECVQDLTGYMQLCYIGYDDRELYESLFYKIGDILSQIWEKFLKEYGDI